MSLGSSGSWAARPVRQVLDALPTERRGLDWKTVQTLPATPPKRRDISRRTATSGGMSIGRSSALVQVVGELTDDFLNRLFDGQVLPLFQHLVNDRGLSDDEIRQLRELLDRLGGRVAMILEFDGLARVAWAQLWQVTIVAVGIGTIVVALRSQSATRLCPYALLDAGRRSSVDRATLLGQPDGRIQLGPGRPCNGCDRYPAEEPPDAAIAVVTGDRSSRCQEPPSGERARLNSTLGPALSLHLAVTLKSGRPVSYSCTAYRACEADLRARP